MRRTPAMRSEVAMGRRMNGSEMLTIADWSKFDFPLRIGDFPDRTDQSDRTDRTDRTNRTDRTDLPGFVGAHGIAD